ncbi:protein O-glucosyltransferase 1 isoform X2 [Brachypodium distachyon]|uniref:Glycosyl transferase CAP10 domain-containing protein n=1 Tax=Brachypodium distachyon TaxID=15368 RepID=A0A2K2DSU0_BRADI|nr:protein O-glucosyltransferase 1 isoform X2 [Brachypodium distachyon]PNT77349.1 hypothetical protein BRADI_1g61560v3 [Brachypodium distachyon]|eukprot:XP_010228584.1 protein O-glucosyltransferase 1 isoform X2 [Brachypodium distachyon]
MTKKNIDGSCCVVFPPAAGEEEGEEAVVLSSTSPPPPPPPPAPVVEHRQYYCSSSTMAWRKTSVTRGGAVGVAAAVVGGLVLMALLVGTTWTAVIHLDDVASSFLPGTGGGISGGRHHHPPQRRRPRASPTSTQIPIPFDCAAAAANGTTSLCSPRPRSPPPPTSATAEEAHSPAPPPPTCPDYFRYIHSDLSPWRASGGITLPTLERAIPHAAFRLTVVSGRAYVETYHRAFQTRDVFTQWGILQLLARYPGRVPDLDAMFNLEDMPEIFRNDADGNPAPPPPPLFRYCKDGGDSVEILFPDWSFWGWPEVNIRPWAPLMENFVRENRALPWQNREPFAFWKGNPYVSNARKDLFKCNNDSAAGKEFNARLFDVDWRAASRNGFKDDGSTNLAKQCKYRYKIYVQGRSWSVSEKYILACDSPMLAIDTSFRDFFSRGLVAGEHYWPIDPAEKCDAVKFAVDWGNKHPRETMRLGEEGSRFAREEMGMDFVYDYMLHVLTEYAALLRYKPTVPEKAVELCPEAMACGAEGREREFMMESRERHVAGYEPCSLPPPFTKEETRDMDAREQEVRRKVVKMEKAGS